MISLRTLQKRVKFGAEQWDKDLPGWASKIDIGKLKLSDIQDCITGQLQQGDAWDTKMAHFLDGEYIPNVGDTGPYPGNGNDNTYVVLKRLWVHQIRKRLKAA